MFKKETVFILGAGASKPYGYPLGKDLISDIIQNITNDYIILPKRYDSNWYIPNDDKQYVFNIFKEKFDQIIPELPINCSSNYKKHLTLHGEIEIFDICNNKIPTKGTKIKIEALDEFYNLKKDLQYFDPVSIDAFLRDHESHRNAGVIMIIYSLLKCENIKKFNKNHHGDEDNDKKKSIDKTMNEDNWYSHLINDILSGFVDKELILENKLNIITFNYSLDLDYCLFDKFDKIESCKNDSGKNFLNSLHDKIHHVYGKLYTDEVTKAYGDYCEKNREDSNCFLNTQRFVKAISSKDNIKLMRTQNAFDQNTEKYTKLIQDAEELIVIGFGFDKDNLNILGFPNSREGYKELIKDKTFKYMDYEGKMNNLHGQLLEVQKTYPNFSDILYTLTRSTGKNISHAYQNDFKISLY